MTTTAPVGICNACGTGFSAGTAFCTGCGAPVRVPADRKVLAERVAATPVYGAPPRATAEPAAAVPSYQPQLTSPAPPRTRRRTPLVAGAVALVVVLILTGLWVASYLRSRPVATALDESTTAYSQVLAALSDARDLDGVRAAGHRATALRATLLEHEKQLAGKDGGFGKAAHGVVQGEREVVEAAATLSGLSESELVVWAQAEQQLVVAGEHLSEAREVLARADGERADEVADPAKAVDHARTVVGDAASRLLGRSVAALVGRLGSVSKSAQVRRIAADATAQREVASAVQPGLAGDGAAAVQAAGVALDQLASLSTLDADHLKLWGDVRGALGDALSKVAGVEGAPAIAHVDAFVADATAKMAAWRAAVDQAKALREAAKGELAPYEDPVRAHLTSYEHLPGIADDLAGAKTGREAILAALWGVVAPPAYAAQQIAIHNALAGEIAVLASAHDSLSDPHCYDDDGEEYDCDLYDTAEWAAVEPSWDAAHAAMEAAVDTWTAAIALTKDQINAPLPEKPVI